jgi:hypothetical protein
LSPSPEAGKRLRPSHGTMVMVGPYVWAGPFVGNWAAALNDDTMETSGSITLVEVADRAAVLAVACTRCERAGRYRLDL